MKKRILTISLIFMIPMLPAYAATDPPLSSIDKKTEKQDNTNKTTDWAHMKNYKVWEANRKEFTYPENYIESETTASGSANSNHKLNKKGN